MYNTVPTYNCSSGCMIASYYLDLFILHNIICKRFVGVASRNSSGGKISLPALPGDITLLTAVMGFLESVFEDHL